MRVPAGVFAAYRLHYRITADDPEEKNVPTWWLRTWYAPEIRQFIAAEGRNADDLEFQLVGVDPVLTAPLRLFVRDPEDRAQVTRDELTVTGRASAGKGIARVTVSVNGAEVHRRDEPRAPPEATVEASVTLREGRDVILVTGRSSTSTSSSRSAVTRARSGPTSTP